ncbi:MAG: hypothetical protein EKK53_23960 [Burkholderiales bacterium]|nr:MAG: hypothetical protein EKK53_23960 [Burkholderiales bacterium]
MKRLTQLWLSLTVALGFAASGLPAHASEVVKLARLVVSGKRSSNEMSRPAATEARSPAPSSQNHTSGGSDAVGTAPAPARGVS